MRINVDKNKTRVEFEIKEISKEVSDFVVYSPTGLALSCIEFRSDVQYDCGLLVPFRP